LANMGLFGLGVLGITYGVLSASWDEERSGSLLGVGEFRTNWGRMVGAWRETRQKNS
jgi:Photosynthesis affected mutant 68